ncbi:MAG: hypothetical protein LBM74_00175, partial [Oscillospiraceae bacterium]|nr:hypothetical protein [Oscillospiraceae bacterium]
DSIYTGTETRDPKHTDQHLPRYLSFSLMRYFEDLQPGKNGGGWFDPYDCQILEHYLEQAYLTAFSKPKELMMFCFQSLVDTMNIAALGYQLDKLDAAMDHAGEVKAVPCYIPCDAQGEDNVQDFLGMAGIPVATTPFFPMEAKRLLLTQSSAYDPEIVDKLEQYLLNGGKAIVTSGFVAATLERGLPRLTSIRLNGRKVAPSYYYVERKQGEVYFPHGVKPVQMPVVEFRNNATWSYVKGVCGEENFAILLRDTYGPGQMLTLTVPDAYSDIRYWPAEALTRIRKEFAAEGDVYLDGPANIGLFCYDNDAFLLYPFASEQTEDARVLIHAPAKAEALLDCKEGKQIAPLYKTAEETVFALRTKVGQYKMYQVV